ncbi:helix-hairpin-helix domain-containing protein [Caulobacter mirabilis]|uniref:Uncharacterized protein n=1 Tax=Caulobacter mirabilis TaxID=69666 RepID=A0A2D2AZX0_9CAUL|nr:helix-hairpin-helix domain-containing protein [Caulobacter mirabilis]ATQ43559.1 hypothetical protein CSW64_14685 [Caulobacter mirabilis]
MSKLSQDAEHALKLPVGVVSPLWLVFAGAAVTGAAFYWANAWLKPTNLEAEAGAAAATPAPLEAAPEPEPEAAPIVEPEAVVEVVAEPAAEAVAEPAAEVVEAVEPAAEETPQVVEAAAPAVDLPVDDLTRLTGVGPKLAASLAERGVTRFADIAAWTADDIVQIDRDLKLLGRIDREAWVAQARRLADAAAN